MSLYELSVAMWVYSFVLLYLNEFWLFLVKCILVYSNGDYFDKFNGVGINNVSLIKDELGLNSNFWDSDVVESEVLEYIDYFMLGSNDINEWLDMEISNNISNNVKINSYQGISYSNGYPIYCQNVSNNGIIANKLNNIN